MPTPATVLDSFLRHVGAALYIVVLLSLVTFLIYETIRQIRFKMEEKKNENSRRCG